MTSHRIRSLATAPPRALRSAVASTGVGWVLDGPPRGGQVIAAVDGAVYVTLPAAGPRAVLALVSPQGVRLPNAVVLTQPLDEVGSGEPVTVGAGELLVGGHRIRAHRRWDPRPRVEPTTPDALAGRLALAHGVLRDGPGMDDPQAQDDIFPGRVAGVEALARAVAARDGRAVAAAADALLGAGPGLTPAGDDHLVGFLVAAHAAPVVLPRQPAVDDLTALGHAVQDAVLAHAAERTTAVSAALLDHAARGEAAAPLAALLTALTGRGDVTRAAARLCRVGHTSGAAMGWGAVVALDALAPAARPETADPGVRGCVSGRRALHTGGSSRQGVG